MKITQVETITVRVPIHEGSWHSPEFDPEGYYYGGQWVELHWPGFPIVLIQVHTDGGLTGLGEAPKGVGAAQVQQFSEFFVGRSIWDFNLQDLPFETMWVDNQSIYEAYEMAMVDLIGKALELPAYRLFGGKFREWVPTSRCTGRMNPIHAAKAAEEAVELGYSVLKMKATAEDPIVERLQAIQDAVGDKLGVIIDPNQRFYHPYRLFQVVDEIQDRGIRNVHCFESPYDHDNLDWYVLARQKINIPLALHLSRPRRVIEAIKREACAWLNLGGAMFPFTKLAATAEAAGIPTWHGSGVGLGVSEAAYTHVCAASRSVTLTSDICGEVLRVDDLITDPLEFNGGWVRVPERPGLGVELDMVAVERYRI
jgi:muconate cycloisomerase